MFTTPRPSPLHSVTLPAMSLVALSPQLSELVLTISCCQLQLWELAPHQLLPAAATVLLLPSFTYCQMPIRSIAHYRCSSLDSQCLQLLYASAAPLWQYMYSHEQRCWLQKVSADDTSAIDVTFIVSQLWWRQSWQVSPLKGNNQGYYRVITLWGEILSAIDKWQKLGRNSFTSFIALQPSFTLPCA